MPDPTRAHAALSRRRLLQLGGVAGMTALLATGGSRSRAAWRGATPIAGRGRAQQESGGLLRIASRVGSIDIGDDLGYPSLERFTAETGIAVDYQEVVEEDEDFFANDLRDALEAGVPTGWDLVVLGDAVAQRLAGLGWLERLDPSAMTSYPANLEDRYVGRSWDSDNLLAAPWHSGMTGVCHDQAVTGPLTDLDPLFGDDYAGRVSYPPVMRDTVGLAALDGGIDPATIDQAGFDAAIGAIEAAVAAGIPRRIPGRSPVEDLLLGDSDLGMAPSTDSATLVIPNQAPGQDFRWFLPDQGGMLWSDNLCVPLGTASKAAAQAFIDWYYVPANAAPIEAFVNGVSPVKGAQEAMRELDPARADDPLIFPTPEMEARLRTFRSLSVEEAVAWEAAFARAIRP